MRIALIAVTRRAPDWLQAGMDEYLKRLPSNFKLELIEVPPVRSTGPADAARRREADRIRAAIPARRRIIALDERGITMSSAGFARRVQSCMEQATDLAFIVGGADGLDPSITDSAHETWALSTLTLPHWLARLLLVEQLYRSATIIANHPYHRA